MNNYGFLNVFKVETASVVGKYAEYNFDNQFTTKCNTFVSNFEYDRTNRKTNMQYHKHPSPNYYLSYLFNYALYIISTVLNCLRMNLTIV